MRIVFLVLISFLSACTTPYHPPVVVNQSAPVQGLMSLLADMPGGRLDVMLVHGMCLHDETWVEEGMRQMAHAVHANGPVAPGDIHVRDEAGIKVYDTQLNLRSGTIHLTALVWSALTTPSKTTLEYDLTRTPVDCATHAVCRPVRATLNAKMKDRLMNDCFADAMIYEGAAKSGINQAFIAAITSVVTEQEARNGGAAIPLVLFTESLGSKMTFDALNLMLQDDKDGASHRAGDRVSERLTSMFMGANQMPLLRLAGSVNQAGAMASAADPQPSHDPVWRFLNRRSEKRHVGMPTIVAFTDPNDLLGYRLLPTDYQGKAHVANVLVSNANSYMGLAENPYLAHTAYLDNPDVAIVMMCGIPASAQCVNP